MQRLTHAFWKVLFKLFFPGLLLGGLAGAIIFILATAGEIYDYQDTFDGAHLPPIDAIVVLSGGRGRIATASELWYRYWERLQFQKGGPEVPVPLLYFSGLGPKVTWPQLSKQIRSGISESIRPVDVILESESTNTEENMAILLGFAKRFQWKRVLIITSAYHMRRAVWIFAQKRKELGITLKLETFSVYQDPFDQGDWYKSLHGFRVTAVEYIKWIYYRLFWKVDPAS